MKLAPDIEDALDRFAEEQGIKREEALSVIARDWLIGLGYLRSRSAQDEDGSAQN
ncbi:hypothetical protein [Shinella sp. BYT-45]|uniref:hypothetical protein n=1 Tax=Shinella sp. BYT-45 TaxID=3377377 RepID=UPI00397E97F2